MGEQIMQRGDATTPGLARVCIRCKRRFIRKFERIVLSPRLVVGLFCIGMVLGLLVRSLVPGAGYGGAGNLAQMDPLSTGSVMPAVHIAHRARSWTVLISTDGSVELR